MAIVYYPAFAFIKNPDENNLMMNWVTACPAVLTSKHFIAGCKLDYKAAFCMHCPFRDEEKGSEGLPRSGFFFFFFLTTKDKARKSINLK